MKKFILTLVTTLSLISPGPAAAQYLDVGPVTGAPVIQGSGFYGLTTGGQSVSAQITIPFDTLGYNSGGVATCSIAGGTAGVCTVVTPGKYRISCFMAVAFNSASAGGTATIRIQKNAADLSVGGVSQNVLQNAVGSASTVRTNVEAQASYAAGDTFSCTAASTNSSPTLTSSVLSNFMSFNYLGQ